jgi:hypothetical protein
MSKAFWGEPTNAAFVQQGIKDILSHASVCTINTINICTINKLTAALFIQLRSALLIQLTPIKNWKKYSIHWLQNFLTVKNIV